jgi:uncharacterized protein YnzC (UPF0291/DUF896 family)
MKKIVKQYLVSRDDVDIILDKNNLQQIIDRLQEVVNQADVPATEIKVRYSECDEGCDEISFYYDRPETDEEYEERIKQEAEESKRRKAYISSQYTKLKNELTELSLLDESGNLINPEV